MSAIVKDVKSKLMYALADVASQLSNVTDEQLPAAFKLMDDGKALFEEGRERFRQRLIDYLKANGQPLGEKGSLTAEIGGAKASAIRTKTGFDAKKVEAMLRRLNLDPSAWMRTTITYSVDNDKMDLLRFKGLVTGNDLKGCLYDPTWRIEVQPVRDES